MVLLADLVVAATEAARRNGGGDAAAEAMAAAGIAMYVEVARVDLGDVPDGRVYRRALALGRELEARARAAGDRKMLGTILHRLGTLNLDPFIAGRSSEAYADSEPVARANLAAALGDAIASIDPAELALPVPLEALRLAEDYLRQAAELRTGDPRARSLKAQGEAMVWRKLLGDPMDDDAIAVVLEQALKELDWDADPQMRLTTLNGLRVLGRPVAGGVERVFERSLDEWARGLGERGARDLVMQACALLRAERPRDALRLLAEARPLSDALGEETRLAHLRAEITMLSELGGDEPPAPGPGELFDAVLELQRRANADRWDIERVFGRVVGLVAASPEHDEEEAALELFEQARALAPLLAGRHAPALDWLDATLLMGTGVNGFRRHDWRAGIAGYAQALAAFLEIGMPGAAQDCLARIVDLSEQPAPDASQAVAAVAGIGPSALQAERVIGRAAAAHIRRAAENVLGDTRGGMGSAEELLAMQMAKGLRFSTALYSGSRYRREEDAVGRDLLEAIAETDRGRRRGRGRPRRRRSSSRRPRPATWRHPPIGIDLSLSTRHAREQVGPSMVRCRARRRASGVAGGPPDRTPQPAPSQMVGAGRLDSARHLDHRAQLARRRRQRRCAHRPARRDCRRRDRGLRPYPAHVRRRLREARDGGREKGVRVEVQGG